ncbi:MAG: single-stranded DNA-binding protein [Cyanobacteria bacterium REEB459]|nr:single-stranded DNA-binding protein [Cyanobacteria bacterium REEB459]
MATTTGNGSDTSALFGLLTETLKRIELAMMALASQHPPNWRKPLSEYGGNWVSRIGAHEIKRDPYGPTVVWWMGHYYLRRCGSNPKYGAAIWFSRPVGSGEEGESGYVRLITFSQESPPTGVESLPDYVVKALGY